MSYIKKCQAAVVKYDGYRLYYSVLIGFSRVASKKYTAKPQSSFLLLIVVQD